MKTRIQALIDLFRESAVEIIAFASAFVPLLQHLGEKSIGYIAVSIVLFVFYLIYHVKIKTNEKTSRGLALLAEEGHIHTTRMLILRDYYENDKKRIAKKDIRKQNSFLAQNVKFSFIINKPQNNISDIQYYHSFDFLSLRNGMQTFAPWFFGEDGAPPKDCARRIGKQKWLTVNAERVEEENSCDYSVNEGIYSAPISLGKMLKGENVCVEFKYKRKAAFQWTREEIFVIWPKCFAKKMEKASFSICFDGDVTRVVNIVEYVCYGTDPKKSDKIQFERSVKKVGNGTVTEYYINDLDIDVNNVYIIYISEPIK